MILHTKDIRAWDAYTIENEPISSVNLMERAARTLAKALLYRLQPHQRILVFCGNGNNGGDGVALAVMLYRLGYDIAVCYLQNPSEGSEDFRYWHDRFHKLGGLDVSALEWKGRPWDVCIDAILGTGLNRPLEGDLKDIVTQINAFQAYKLAVDTPTGMLCNQWENKVHTVFNVHETFTFQVYKWAFVHSNNVHHTGKITRLDIGLHPDFQPKSIEGQILDSEFFKNKVSWTRSQLGEKAQFGSTLVIGGGLGMVGAATFAGKSAVRCGSGWTQIAVPTKNLQVIQALAPETTACTWDSLESSILQKPSTLVVGPGLGKTKEATDLVDRLLHPGNPALVLDADALNIIAAQQWHHRIPKKSIITPHEREFQRLFGTYESHEERLEMQRTQSEKQGIYIVFKGPFSTVSTPEGALFFNSSGNAALAKAGSGDLLSGMIGGLVSRTKDVEQSVLLAVYLHGLLGDYWTKSQSAESFTPEGGIALISTVINSVFPNSGLQ